MPVAMNKGTGWFFKMGAGVFITFINMVLERIKDIW